MGKPNYLENDRAWSKMEWNFYSFVYMYGVLTFAFVASKAIWGHSVHLQFSENITSKRYYFYKSQRKFAKLVLNYLSQWSSQKYIWNFWSFENFMSTIFLSSLTWSPIGVRVSKLYSSFKWQPNVFNLVLGFRPYGPQKICWRFSKFSISL